MGDIVLLFATAASSGKIDGTVAIATCEKSGIRLADHLRKMFAVFIASILQSPWEVFTSNFSVLQTALVIIVTTLRSK